MNNNQIKFDPVQYKKTTRQQWESAATAWDRWGPLLSEWLGPATERMLDMVDVGEGSHVLDVAAGAGEQTMAVARRIGKTGHVLATDISPSILEYAEAMARKADLNNVGVRELDGECLTDLEANLYDAVISRVGLIYFPDQQKALRGMKHTLKENGKVGAIVYSTPDRNAFFSDPVSIIRRRANLPPPLLGQPGPFSLGGEGVLKKAFSDAGFRNIEVEVVEAPVRLKTAADCLRFEKESFGALHQMLASLTAQEQSEAWDEVGEKLREFENGDGFEGPCEFVIAVGTK